MRWLRAVAEYRPRIDSTFGIVNTWIDLVDSSCRNSRSHGNPGEPIVWSISAKFRGSLELDIDWRCVSRQMEPHQLSMFQQYQNSDKPCNASWEKCFQISISLRVSPQPGHVPQVILRRSQVPVVAHFNTFYLFYGDSGDNRTFRSKMFCVHACGVTVHLPRLNPPSLRFILHVHPDRQQIEFLDPAAPICHASF